jgi:hypothetical protein
MFSRSKSRIMFPIKLPPCFHQFHYVSIPLPPYIHSIYIGPHTCTSWFDCMPYFSGSMVWLCNICWSSMYRLSLHLWTPYKPIDIGWEERRHNVILPYAKNTTYFERREKAKHHYCLGEDPQIPQMRDLRG